MSEQQQNPPVDLVIVIDTSVSLKDDAAAASQAAEAALEAARAKCPADLRVVWLGIEGTWKETLFERTLRHYLTAECGVAAAALRGRQRGELKGGGAQEDGARAIEDIAKHFDWRPQAKRAVFFLGDEALEGGGDQVDAENIEAADRAIQTARAAAVSVHTYFGKSRSRHKQALQQEYARLARETGGQAFTAENVSAGFATVLEDSICASRAQAIAVEATAGQTGAETCTLLTTGLADYGYWWQRIHQEQPAKAAHDFRRGRIWA